MKHIYICVVILLRQSRRKGHEASLAHIVSDYPE